MSSTPHHPSPCIQYLNEYYLEFQAKGWFYAPPSNTSFSSPKILTAQWKLAVFVCFYFSRQTVNSWGTPSKYYDIWCAVMAFKRFVVVVIVERLTDFFWKRGQYVLWLLASWVSVYNQPEDWIRAPSRIHSWLVHFPDAPRTCYHISNRESTEARVILK